MENNQLVKIEQLPFHEIMTISKSFAESGMFADTKQAAQAFVKIQAGQEIGIPPFAAMSGIHIIQGKPTIGAGLIASRVKGSGKYDYEVKEMTEANCSIDFFQGKKMIGNSSFSIADAKKAQTKNIDKFPKNMLFARCISNGVKWFCPDVFSGPVYTPEEMDTTFEIIPNTPNAEQQETLKADVQDAIIKLGNCNNVEELTLLKDMLSEQVVKHIDFKSAAKARFEIVKPAANVTQ